MTIQRHPGSPRGLYDPSFEHDACGVGFVAALAGGPTHAIVRHGLDILLNLEHRGACGCDPLTGDGAGMLLQLPHAFFAARCGEIGIRLPEPGDYGVGCVFLPQDERQRERCRRVIEDKIFGTGQRLLGWRDVEVDAAALGPQARERAPVIQHVFIGSTCADQTAFERQLYVIRKWSESTVRAAGLAPGQLFDIPSLSSRTVIYKGLMLAQQLVPFYRDLDDPIFVSALAMVHQRFSTNTLPTWELAQPFRMLAHNGEINTVRGNVGWIRAREKLFDGRVFGHDVSHVLPTVTPGLSDSAALDNVAELLVQAGRSLPQVMMMLVPEAWEHDEQMDSRRRAFYEYHACLMEGWDGPAALTFTDGRLLGGMLDRNGLRPGRWTVTRDGLVLLASEAGVLDLPPERIDRQGRLEPGRMFLVDLEAGRLVEDAEIKERVCGQRDYGGWVRGNKITLEAGPEEVALPLETGTLEQRQRLFGYTQEDLRLLLAPMAETGKEPIGAMGTDTPLAVLSEEPLLLFDYFKQHFAQVTNPAIDPIREAQFMSLRTFIGGEGNLLDELPDQAVLLELEHPLLASEDLARLRRGLGPRRVEPPTLPLLFPIAEGVAGLRRALGELCRLASKAVLEGFGLLVLSDRGANEALAPIPSLLGTGAVHHHLVRNGTRMRAGMIVETAEAREVHHIALLIGYGAGAVNPYLAFESVEALARERGADPLAARANYVQAINKGLLKVLSKMGISTLQSYQGAQIFEAIGLSPELIERYFTGTASRISGIDQAVVAEDCRLRHSRAYPKRLAAAGAGSLPIGGLPIGGQYQYRAQGERHLWSPQNLAALQQAVRLGDADAYARFAAAINEQGRAPITLRGTWDLVPPGRSPAGQPGGHDLALAHARAVPLDEVEPATEIVKRFATGAMSFGSLGAEAHETLALAMNRIGAKSNTGEGGEREERYGDARRSAIKQVASGRFGVTTHYLVSAEELQIKVAQGAKPGEGGQLPGVKVDAVIAKTRFATPGVTLISPPPHHDIYSIEDLAQLIFDLKNVNPPARISVKLVAAAGVGTVAAGVAKAMADVILISGYDGGTGASPLTSIKHAGVPWELGLAETHQTLVRNDLRSRVVLQTDGQLRTGRDVVFACLLGAEEFGFATAPLVAAGCVMTRKCHENVCPVGVATQDPVLRAKFSGRPEHVINYFFFVAEEVRELMSQLGFRRVEEMVGRVDRIAPRELSQHRKAAGLDFSDVLAPALAGPGVDTHYSVGQDHSLELDRALDKDLIRRAGPALYHAQRVRVHSAVRNCHRAVGAMLAGEITRRHGVRGLPPGTVDLYLEGSAGQSFGAFMVDGMDVTLDGQANDYVGKGMSGGVLAVRPPRGTTFRAADNVLIGNVALYGATGGKAFFSGTAGERFAVRNSGAVTVVEGVGNHGCEYMTGGRVLVLGRTGTNFAAGMSGGYAYVLDEDGGFADRCNRELVALEALDGDDEALVLELLAEHARRTISVKARELVESWEDARGKLIKVVPLEYRRALGRPRRDAA